MDEAMDRRSVRIPHRARRGRLPARRASLALATTVVAIALGAGCSSRTDSGGDSTAAPSTASPPTTADTTTADTTTADTSTADTSTSTTAASTTTSTSSSSTSSSSSTTTTTITPPVGGFACIPAEQHPTIWETRPPSAIPSPVVPDEWLSPVLGHSVQGREIQAFVRPSSNPRRTVVVIGGIHGNEPVTPPAVRGLFEADIADDVELWLVPVANPDGSAAGMRCNANSVDLNRNFSWEWRPNDGGPGPLSEPETQALAALVGAVEPDLVIWVHQPLDYVSAIGPTDDRLEEAWSLASGLPVRPDVRQHGGGESWTAFVAGYPSMLIEIDGWMATPEIVDAQRAGFEATLRALG